jgi:D-sedoheptulose 7-phosphate isomerase
MNKPNNNHFSLNYVEKLKIVLDSLDTTDIESAIDLIYSKWREGKQIITLGNGGSSMTALHFITDWNKSIFMSSGIPFRGRTLVDNMGIIMAYGNDLSFNDVFSEQLKNVMQPGDLVIAISGSGNSENVIRAVEYANNNGGITLGLSGFSGGKLKNLVHHSIWVNVNDMQLSEDVHSIFGHMVMQKLCNK